MDESAAIVFGASIATTVLAILYYVIWSSGSSFYEIRQNFSAVAVLVGALLLVLVAGTLSFRAGFEISARQTAVLMIIGISGSVGVIAWMERDSINAYLQTSVENRFPCESAHDYKGVNRYTKSRVNLRSEPTVRSRAVLVLQADFEVYALPPIVEINNPNRAWQAVCIVEDDRPIQGFIRSDFLAV